MRIFLGEKHHRVLQDILVFSTRIQGIELIRSRMNPPQVPIIVE